MKKIDQNAWVTELVIQDYRIASVLSRYGINYCCGGKYPLKLACEERGLKVDNVIAEMDAIRRPLQISPTTKFAEWPLDFLTDYIVNIHHEFLKQRLDQIGVGLSSFVEGHKKKFGGLVELEEEFRALSARLRLHILHEENMIFPYIKTLFRAYSSHEPYAGILVRTLRKPIEDEISGNSDIGNRLNRVRELSENYQITEKACASQQVALMSMQELDSDLVQHMHLENNILFPAAIAMELELSQKVDC